MYEEVVEEILKSLDKEFIPSTYPKFSGEGYKPYKIDIRNFRKISKLNSNKRIAFVDGGNAEIISSANFSLSLIRTCFVVYKNNQKIAAKRFEILAFVNSVNENNEIHYKTTLFGVNNPINLEEISFSSFDHTLMVGINRAEIGSVANAIRRFMELKAAKQIADEKIAEVIVLDGNLQATITNENKYLNELYESCSRNNVILATIGKTNSLFTDDGNLLSFVLDKLSPLQSWLYNPIAEIKNSNHKAEMYFAKFHDKSRHIFRFEIFNKQKEKAEEIISELASNSVDPVFIGYPYGLVEADRVARVSNQEKESLKTMFLVKLRSKNIEKYMNSANAHEILDRISF